MNFTPKSGIRPVTYGILTIAVVGLIGWAAHVAPPSAPITATQHAFAVQGSLQSGAYLPVVPAVQITELTGLETARSTDYQTASYKSKHWWKRNAPIIGGAGGGALVGGLLGGGTGALVGGAVGGGGGYLYKRSRRHHHYH